VIFCESEFEIGNRLNQMNKPILFLTYLAAVTMSVAQTVPSTTGSKANQKDAQEALDFHNKVRKDVGTKPLQWSTELAKYAQAWADNLANTGCDMKHRPHAGEWKQIHGENIFWGSGAGYTVLNASESWYSEIKDYKHGPLTNDNWADAGHYTQMVWKSTTQVGIAQVTCKGGEILIVANYDPPGNYMGDSAY
jgi:pathogenesis-related protein 1